MSTQYWMPSWPIGFGGDLAGGNLGSVDGSGARGGGVSNQRYNFSNGWFVGGEGGGLGLGMNGLGQDGAFGGLGSLHYEGVQFGYNFQNSAKLPISVYAGFDTLKYKPATSSAFAAFDSAFNSPSSTVPGYSAHAGVEFKPTSNLSLSLGFGYTQTPTRLDSDINSLPGASPFAFGAR
jgi:opacity protein-like surface antigen